MQRHLNDIHVNAEQVLITPEQLRAELPLSQTQRQFVLNARQQIADIIHHQDQRLLVVTGPCSIHDVDAALDYAKQLKQLQLAYQDSVYIVMRVYFEKPRTTVGWKGLINDPNMDGSFDIEQGLIKARKLLLALTDMELPLATEALDPISPQYLSELFSWSAIGARTTESQTHREMASGLSMPVGFKNGTDGSLEVAINALKAAASPHSFMGINKQGQVSIINTSGNPDGHIILRGGGEPNYDPASIEQCVTALKAKNIVPSLVIDCSHANSAKDHNRQPIVAKDVVAQRKEGNQAIIGIMLESHINAGRQDLALGDDVTQLAYGVSITDACIDFTTTKNLIDELAQSLK